MQIGKIIFMMTKYIVENLEGEVWLPIKNFEGYYEISNLGNVKSVSRIVACSPKSGHEARKVNERILKPSISKGYYHIKLAKNGKIYSRQIARLVLENFNPIENIDKLQVNHIDSNPLNNKLSNLEWVTPIQNLQHAKIFGNYNNTGINNGRAKLSEQNVFTIREMYKSGEHSHYDLAKIFKIHPTNIWRAVRRMSWKHL